MAYMRCSYCGKEQHREMIGETFSCKYCGRPIRQDGTSVKDDSWESEPNTVLRFLYRLMGGRKKCIIIGGIIGVVAILSLVGLISENNSSPQESSKKVTTETGMGGQNNNGPQEPVKQMPQTTETPKPTAASTPIATPKPTATPEPTAEPTSIPTPESTATPAPEPTAQPTSHDSVNPELKVAMDEYEKFVDEYVAFMKRYAQSDNPMAMMMDYFNMLATYEKMINKIDALDEENMSEADYLYYTEVMLRCTQKMAGAAV